VGETMMTIRDAIVLCCPETLRENEES
jgi:hypothetical protein